jgi:hypothetical protein
MKKRSNITLLIIAILLLSIPVVGFISLKAVKTTDGVRMNGGVIIVNKADSDSLKTKVSVSIDAEQGTSVSMNKEKK